MFPATPGMIDLVSHAKALGYAIFWITGRGDSQHAATIANLVNDTAAGFPNIDVVTYNGPRRPGGRRGVRVANTARHRPRRTSPTACSRSRRWARTRRTSTRREFCGPYIHATPAASCPTIQYKSGTRAYIESKGYDIVADFGDQFSDLEGGYADKVFKMPNPNYYLP